MIRYKKPEDYIGIKFGKLEVMSISHKNRYKNGRIEYFYNCHCDCGNDCIRTRQSINDNCEDRISSCKKCPTIEEDSILIKTPYFVKYLQNKDDAVKYRTSSHARINMVCDKCNNIRELEIKTTIENGFYCPICSNKTSYPEKLMNEILKDLNISYDREVSFDWSQNKRYDFYIPSLNCIIETHGMQHYRQTFPRRELKDEVENDKIKEILAKENGIKNYFQIDCRESSTDYIKKSIMKSDLNKIINIEELDLSDYEKKMSAPRLELICNKWKEGVTIKEISIIFKISKNTVRSDLKKGSLIGWCDYNPKKSCKIYRDNTRIGELSKHKVKCIELNLEFKSIKECCIYMIEYTGLNFIHTGISASCSGRRSHYRNYHFEYIS